MIKTKKKKNKIIYISLISILLLISIFSFFYFANKKLAIQVLDSEKDLDSLIKQASQRSYILLGESSHGTKEYYIWRKKISQRLITEHGFDFILVEGDWDALYNINLYVKHLIHPENGAKELLSNFKRWPTWMWANYEFLSLVEWLRDYNANLELSKRVGIYGKDVYGLNNSMLELIDYINKVDESLALEIKDLYNCLLVYNEDFSSYIYDVFNKQANCQKPVSEVLNIISNLNHQGLNNREYFKAKQDALVVFFGEEHYRNNITAGPSAWNSRVMGMFNRFENLLDFYGPESKAIIWAHNTHIGDARATSMKDNNMINIGQLLKEEYGENKVYAIGFGTNTGTVRASFAWGETGQVILIPHAQEGSLEHYLNQFDYDNFYILLDQKNLSPELSQFIPHRAKGVVYNPNFEEGNYVKTIPKDRYDAFIWFKSTSALTPL